jgi:hypothetical protein
MFQLAFFFRGIRMDEQDPQQAEHQVEPKLLYHYTTLDGLLGILDKKELWATGISYLNDTSEFEAGKNALFDLMFSRPLDGADVPEDVSVF